VDLTTPVDFIGLRNDPAVSYLNIAIRHSVHHRGLRSYYLPGCSKLRCRTCFCTCMALCFHSGFSC
jgi:hypothetical protein